MKVTLLDSDPKVEKDNNINKIVRYSFKRFKNKFYYLPFIDLNLGLNKNFFKFQINFGFYTWELNFLLHYGINKFFNKTPTYEEPKKILFSNIHILPVIKLSNEIFKGNYTQTKYLNNGFKKINYEFKFLIFEKNYTKLNKIK